jgi:aminoglycoside 6'-N-acetyltransferase
VHDDPTALAFRPLQRADFPLLGRWLAEPLVARWWHHDTTPAALERDFGPTVDGREATEAFLALACDRPFGYIQCYPIAAYPEYARELATVREVPPGALSIDYFIAEPELRGRGLGAAMIAEFVAGAWSRHPQAADVIVPVAAGNTASWRALERAGFRRIAAGELEPDNPRDPADHFVYRLRRVEPA